MSVFDPPLEEWLLGIIRRCAARRAAKFPIEVREAAFASAFEEVSGMFHDDLPNLLIIIPRAAPDTNYLMARFRIRWSHYRHIARAADERLVRVFHDSPPLLATAAT